jgi:hypothetical protein
LYLNEFDRYVRHIVKPLDYIRYGDDFMLFVGTKQEAEYFQKSCTTWIKNNLSLDIHMSNNVVFPAKAGAHFLGHWIYPRFNTSVDKAMKLKILKKLTRSNVATYKSMKLRSREIALMSWRLSGE